nr:hypothetical protein [Tanacetum cinerariifolium]
ETVDVSEESGPEPAKRRMASRRVVRKKVTISVDDNIIPDPDVALELCSEQESEYSKEDLNEKEDIDWIDSKEDEEKKDDTDDDKSIDLKKTDDEETDDEVFHGKEQVNENEDEEMLNVEVEDSRKGDPKAFDAAKADAEKIKEAKYDSKKAELPPTNAEISSLLDIKIQSKVPHIQSISVFKVPVSIITERSVLTPVQETPSATPLTTLTPPSLRVEKLEKDVSELKKIDHFAKALATLKS